MLKYNLSQLLHYFILSREMGAIAPGNSNALVVLWRQNWFREQ